MNSSCTTCATFLENVMVKNGASVARVEPLPTPGELRSVALAAVITASDVLRSGLGRAEQVQHKGRADLVSEMDRACERCLREQIRQQYPNHAIVGEEDGGKPSAAEITWYLDPIDGTMNYVHGLPWFALSVGVWRGDQPVLAVITAPALQLIWTAIAGGGAWLGDRSISVSSTAVLAEACLGTDFPADRFTNPANNRSAFWRLELASSGVRRMGSGVLGQAAVATGWLDGYWEPRIYPWDGAAGSLLVREAGGRSTTYAGRPWTPSSADLLAGNVAIHTALLAELRQDQC